MAPPSATTVFVPQWMSSLGMRSTPYAAHDVRAPLSSHGQVEDAAGVKVSIGSQATAAALRRYGGVRRIAVLSPY